MTPHRATPIQVVRVHRQARRVGLAQQMHRARAAHDETDIAVDTVDACHAALTRGTAVERIWALGGTGR